MNKLFSQANISIDESQQKKFSTYYEMLIEWNTKMNLTTITDYEEVIEKHFIDSLKIMDYYELTNKRIIDIGTGAGFPGIPLAIMNPKTEFVLMDSLQKRLTFLDEVCKELCLNNVTLVHGRAEDLGQDSDYREMFDCAVSRAVAGLPVLCEFALPFVKIDGEFVSYKAAKASEELEQAKHAIDVLGGKLEHDELYQLPFSKANRHILVIKKDKHTPNKYPRRSGVPIKKPIV